MGEYDNNGKLLHATKSRTLRELVQKANKLQIPREDVVTVIQENGSYVLLYYYAGVEENNGIQ